MPLLERLKDNVTKVFPKKDEEEPIDTSHLGYGNSLRPFQDDMIISKPAIVLHTLQVFFGFLAMACFASLAAFQSKHGVGPSGLSGFAIFITVIIVLIPLFFIAIPVVYDKWNKFNRLARTMREVRVQFILAGTGAVLSLLISFIVTISAWTQPGCKNPDDDPNADKGDDFKNGLSGWCSTKKAGAVFCWLAFGAWIGTFVLAVMDWRSGKSNRARDPPFTHPQSASGYAPSIRRAEAGEYEEDDEGDEDEEPFSYPDRRRQEQNAHSSSYYDRPVSGSGAAAPQIPPFRANSSGGFAVESSPFADDYRAPPYAGHTNIPPPAAIAPPPQQPQSSQQQQQQQGSNVSRTMQYADPYAAIKANLVGGTAPGHAGSDQDYTYTGYR